jgi:putative redox protein
VFEVETRTVAGRAAAVGSAGPYTLVVDRPADGGGDGIGFNGGQLLYLAVAGCVSNDLYREAPGFGIRLDHVRVCVRGDFDGDPPVSTPVEYEVELSGDADPARLRSLVEHVDRIAEIPNSLRGGTDVTLAAVHTTN